MVMQYCARVPDLCTKESRAKRMDLSRLQKQKHQRVGGGNLKHCWSVKSESAMSAVADSL